ncbi:15557_t:CDS:2, partial [Racocetra fulgida]
EIIVNDNELQEFEDKRLEEIIVNDNESQEFEDESMMFKLSNIDESKEENSTVFELKHLDKYQAKKKADNEDIREYKSVKIDCQLKVNLNLSGGA